MGNTGNHGMTTVLMIGGVICIAIAVAGGTAQSLKTTFIIGGNPRNIQAVMFVALSVASIAAAGTLMMLNKAYGIGSLAVPAPQATLMKMIVQGIMTAQLPWTLVAVGVALAVFCFLVDIPILAVALGIYLPIGLTAAVCAGGQADGQVDAERHREDRDVHQEAEQRQRHAHGHQGPRQLGGHDALHDHLHERRLGRGNRLAADPIGLVQQHQGARRGQRRHRQGDEHAGLDVLGLPPMMKVVLRLWAVPPATAMAMQMTPPIISAVVMPWPPVLPMSLSTVVMMSRAAMVMPETGLLEAPIRPDHPARNHREEEAEQHGHDAPTRPPPTTGRTRPGGTPAPPRR